MTNELIKNDTVRLTIEKAKEHAKKIESIIIVTDEDFKIAKKEKATAKNGGISFKNLVFFSCLPNISVLSKPEWILSNLFFNGSV